MVKKYEYKPLEFDGDDGEGMEVWVKFGSKYYVANLLERSDQDHFWCRIGPNDDVFYKKYHVADLYTRHEVEEPEQREPRECWVSRNLGEHFMLLETAAFCGLEEARDTVAGPDFKVATKFREVIPPVVKEMPDSEGWWFRNGCIQRFEIRNGEWYTFSRDWGYWKSAEQLPKGNWLFVTPLIEQAFKDAEAASD